MSSNAVLPHYAKLIDPRTGIIGVLQKVEYDAHLPQAIHSWSAYCCDGMVLADAPTDRIASGTYFDSERARLAAIGEAVERYVGNIIAKPLLRGSYAELTRKGYPLLDPLSIPLYSESQYATRGFPFKRLTRELPVYWVEGHSVTRNLPVWVPASLVYINYYLNEYEQEPKTNFVIYSGIACGASKEAAMLSGLTEIIERDGIEIWWRAGGRKTALRMDDEARIRACLVPKDDTSQIRYKFFMATSDIHVPVCAALLEDPLKQIVTVGTAARTDEREACLKALTEAVQLHHLSADILNPDGTIWKFMKNGIYHSKVLKPYNADRAYRSIFRRDRRDMIDLYSTAQYYLDPNAHEEISSLLQAPETASLKERSAVQPRFADLVEELDRLNLECICVDLTTPDIAACGLSVVRMLAPGVALNAPAAFPFLGSPRLYEVPYKLGWSAHPLKEEDLQLIPLPHS